MKIEHIHNFRCIGGNVLHHKRIKKGKLYRSGNLFDVHKEDIEEMRHLGIRYIVDLRSDEECCENPYELPSDFHRFHVSALHTRDGLENFYFFMLIDKNSSSEEIRNAASFVHEGYRVLPFHNEAIQVILDLMERDAGAILFHCSSGKDRTGVIAALLQKLLGVGDTDIMEDYMRSNDYVMSSAIAHAEELGFCGKEKETLVYCCTVHEELLRSSWEEVLKKYSDWDSFFYREYGLDEKKRTHLRSLYVEDSDEK